nr:acyltransferase [Rhodoferax sp. BLA1]
MRGLACFLLVFGHLIGYPLTSGLRLDEGNVFHLFNVTLEHTRMPLFAFLGGIVFSFRGIVAGKRSAFLKGKVVRLLVPLIFVGPLFVYVQKNSGVANIGVTGDSIDYYLSVLWMSRFHYWFLQAMFLVFSFHLLLSFLVKKPLIQYLLGMIFGSICLILLPSDINIFSLSGFFFLLPFFSFGALLGILRIDDFKSDRAVKLVAIAIFLIFAYYKFESYGSGGWGKDSLFGLIFGLISCFMLYSLGIQNRILIFIGNFSFSIYLYHVFFLAAVRVVLVKLGITDVLVNIFFGMVMGISGPIAVHVLLSKFNLTSIAFLGQKKAAS